MRQLIKKINEFSQKKILVIGDLILDQYTFGSCTRKNPEAPSLILDVLEETYNLGGAGNTAVNIADLGSQPSLIGIIGTDVYGEIFIEQLKEKRIGNSGVLMSPFIKTIRKERLFSEGQQVGPRIDHNDKILERQEHSVHIFNHFNLIDSSDIVVISDYAKGTLSQELIGKIIEYSKKQGKTIIIDPRPQHSSAYKNASFITPNFKEACGLAGRDLAFSIDNARELAKQLHMQTSAGIVLTMSENGILYYDGKEFRHFPTFKREVRDVSGAGDAVVASLAVGLANNLDISEALCFSNHAGGVKVEKSRVQPVCLKEIIRDIKIHNNLENQEQQD